ncbi:hypothetical protein CFS9_37180 [Flavobacterium sp. CFS9]|uniref:HTH araC/xylS-type domain-containing protein n=1 Tax=Flavobacterium sp. CFS9 TaxID=3143118 RepID=A0AAT9H6G1_9FLAO
MVKYLLVISLCFGYNVNAQKTVPRIPDSLKSADFDYLFDCIEKQDIDSAKREIFLKAFLDKARSEKNWEELSNAYKNYVHYAPAAQKLIYADSMVMAAKKSNDNSIIGSAYLSRGVAYYGQKRLRKAMDSYLIADQYISKTDDGYLIHKTKYQIAQIKFYLGYYHEAISLFNQCTEYFKDNDDRAYLNSLHSLGACYKMVGNHGMSTEINRLGIAEGIRRGNLDMQHYFVQSEGINQCLIHNYESALHKLQSSLSGIRSNSDFSNEMVSNFYIGKCFWGLNEKEKAMSYFKKVDLGFSQHAYMRPDLRQAYEYMISYYRDRKMIEAQLHYVERLLAVDKKLHITYTYLQGKIRKEYETQDLLREQQILRHSVDSQKNNDRISISVICILFLLILLGIIWFFKSRSESRKKYEELLQKIEIETRAKSEKTDELDFAISSDVEQAVLQSLKKFEVGRKFLEKGLNLTKLAGHFNTNTKYLSVIIARHRNQNFSQYINSLKIDYIAKRIRNEKTLQNYTHDALALEAGFSTTRRFVKAFVSCTGITPKYFIEELRKDENLP